MRKYTSPAQKVEMYSEKYNLEKTEVHRILSEYEDLLTLDELKIKYDNPNIGQLPEWLTDEELDKMIWKTIKSYWSAIFDYNTTREDLYMDLQIYIRLKIKLYSNHAAIKTALVKRMLKLAKQDYPIRNKHVVKSIDDCVNVDNDSSSLVIGNLYFDEKDDYEDTVFLTGIRSIKDKSIRNLLIITGYLICNITSLKKDYLEILREYDENIQNNIKHLEYLTDTSELALITSTKRRRKLKIEDIIKALNLYNDKNTKSYPRQKMLQTMDTLKEYLQESELFDALLK